MTTTADGVVLDVRDALVFTTEITERSEIECQRCVGLKLELNKIAMELESASKVIEILKEELSIADALSSANTSALRNTGNGSQISTSERNWIQIQTKQHKKVTDKLKEHKETYVRTSNRFEVLTNLKEERPRHSSGS
jgi:hypothetical protein